MSPDGRPAFTEGQVVTVFRSRRAEGTEGEYGPLAASMLSAAREAPGFVDFATFRSETGEHVSIVTFESSAAHAAWRDDPRHRAAQERGRAALYHDYSIQVAVCTAVTQWERHDG